MENVSLPTEILHQIASDNIDSICVRYLCWGNVFEVVSTIKHYPFIMHIGTLAKYLC